MQVLMDFSAPSHLLIWKDRKSRAAPECPGVKVTGLFCSDPMTVPFLPYPVPSPCLQSWEAGRLALADCRVRDGGVSTSGLNPGAVGAWPPRHLPCSCGLVGTPQLPASHHHWACDPGINTYRPRSEPQKSRLGLLQLLSKIRICLHLTASVTERQFYWQPTFPVCFTHLHAEMILPKMS